MNGYRASFRKGFGEWLYINSPDVVCLQEIKATPDVIPSNFLNPFGYKTYWFPAEKKGYSGVAIMSKNEPDNVVYGMENEYYDIEGRVIRADFGDLSVISVYFPSGTSGEERQQYKEEFLVDFHDYVLDLMQTRKNLIIAGDVNICHKAIDIHNPKGLKNYSGFLPHERKWVSGFLENTFIDSFRYVNQDPDYYTWWSYRAGAKKNNKGWRIDYIFVPIHLQNAIREHVIHRDLGFSDHVPIELELEI